MEMNPERLSTAVSIAKRQLAELDRGEFVPDADDNLWVASALLYAVDLALRLGEGQ